MPDSVDFLKWLTELRGLTLWQPWSWVIARSWEEGSRPQMLHRIKSWVTEPKRIENRPRVLTAKRRVVFLHAGLTFDQDAEDDLKAAGFTMPDQYARGAVEAVAVLTGRVFRHSLEVPEGQFFWWSGPIAMEIGEVVPLEEPVACSGKQGLWKPSREVVSRVADQVDLNALL